MSDDKRTPFEPATLASTTAAAVSKFGLCDPCLGRRYAGLGTGLTNLERGQAARASANVAEALPTSSCYVCQGLFDELDTFASIAVESLAPWAYEHFLIGSRVDFEVEQREREVDLALETADSSERIQSELNREIGKRVQTLVGKDARLKSPDITVIVDTRYLDTEIEMASVYVYGRYRKHDRTIPQTKWPCSKCRGSHCDACGMTGQQYSGSVEAFVAAPFLAASGATDESFHGAGREDIDAKSLGRGRPFILELKDPRVRQFDLTALPEQVRAACEGRVEVADLRFTIKAEVAALKEARGGKAYAAFTRFGTTISPETLKNAVASLRGQAIAQRTPNRVSHRRADKVRDRRVRDMQVLEHDGETALIEIRGDAGLYIKELISGDDGRTSPSLAALVETSAKVEELDIVDVEYDETPWTAPTP